MLIAPLPAFVAHLRRAGFTASFAAEVAHDSPASLLGAVKTFAAAGLVELVGGDVAGVAGDQGGLFSAAGSGGEIMLSFNRDGLGDGFAEGEAQSTAALLDVTDGQSTVAARIRVTVRKPLAPPASLTPIPDQMDMLP
ncbi:MAG: hypothetical protein WD969_01015 [Paracoccaceae bacterium]